MTSKRTKAAATDDELGDLFQGIGDDTAPKKAAGKSKGPAGAAKGKADDDILAELENQLGEDKPSRPHTPRIKDVKRSATPTEDKPSTIARKSTESPRSSLQASFTPSATSSELQESEKKGPVEQTQAHAASSSAGGGWWGGILSTASAAIKQAEATYKEIQQNEEAKKWAEQVRGLGSNVGALRAYGDEIRHRAMPTFTNILHTLAPPISSHERLLIHITHDLVGYPSLDPLITDVFSRVMGQVEGGDLLVVQRGKESTVKSPTSDKHGFFTAGLSDAGWRDGPWWRDSNAPRDLGVIKGLTEGTKLCRASAEGYSNDYFSSTGGVEAARQRAIEPVSESNPVRSSDLFLAVQALSVEDDKTLFAGTTSTEKEKETSDVLEEDTKDELICFAVYIFDPVHEIRYSTISQTIPSKWIRWLDATTPLTPASGEEGIVPSGQNVPDEIREIVESGGVDPREWVAEWVEEVLSLAVGVVAQRYVARRMGVGEGGIGKGKRRMEEIVQDGGGEMARAGVL